MVPQELSNLFDSMSRDLNPNVQDEVKFLIDDYLDAFGISDDVFGRQMFNELYQHLGTRQLLLLLSEVFKVTDQMDLCRLIENCASQFPSEDVVRLKEESPYRSHYDANTDTEISPTSVDDNSLCQESSIQTDAGNSEAVSILNSLRSTHLGGLQVEDESSDSSDVSASRNLIILKDLIDPLNPLVESPQRRQQISSEDSGFSTESASTTSPSSVASSSLFRRESSGTDGETELDTPIEMKTEEMKTYITDKNIIGTGGFGTVFKGEYKKKPVAIKTGRFIQGDERQFLKEKQLAFLRNTFVVPILGYTAEKDEMPMIMYPYMSSSDLTKVCEDLDWRNRLRVFYQCSEGLAFLHRPVQGVRNEIIHGDIKPGNILLDVNLNARLGDVGVAAELPKDATHYTATANMVYGTEGYGDPYDRQEGNAKHIRRKDNDVFSLGVVGLQFLKWQPAVLLETDEEGLQDKLLLRVKLFKKIKRPRTAQQLLSLDEFFDKNIWHQDQQDSKVNEEVAELILACLEPLADRVAAEGLACKLKELLVANNIPRYIFTVGKFCQYCCINVADVNPMLIPCSDTCRETCAFKQLCQICQQTAYRNPLYCPEHGRLKQFIRPEECYAVLISGFDDEEEDQKVFDVDAQNMLNIITDPRVMGFSQNNMILINKNIMEKRKEIINALEKLKDKPVEMLIVYYSGHGTEETEGDPELNISKDDLDNMTDQELQKLLDSVKCTRLLVILDCCYAARYQVVVEKPGGPVGWRIQLNGTGAARTSDLTETTFTRHIICAVNGFHICPGTDDENAPPCHMCVKFKKLSEARGYIDVYDFIGFCSEHMKLKETNDEDYPDPNMLAAGILRGEAQLALCNSKPFRHIFQYQNKDESEKFHLWNLKCEPDDILRELWDKINACCSLAKHTDYRCLKMLGLVQAREKELRTREELVQQFARGHIVQVRIRSTGSDVDRGKNVVVFCSQHDKFTDMLKGLKTPFDSWFQEEEPEKDNEAEYSCIIKCGETDEITDKITSMWNFSSYDEKKDFSSVLRDSLRRANTLSREQLLEGQPPVSGLRIDVTKEFALLALV